MGRFKEMHLDSESRMAASIDSEYLRWLCRLVSVDQMEEDYWALINRLHDIPFYWTIEQDENRCEDGARLRTRFLEEEGLDIKEDFSSPCTVLEMLIGLAIRMEFQLWDIGEPDRTADRFWELIDNLGLLRFTDDEYYFARGEEYVTEVVHNMMYRRFTRSGDGSLFPLKRSRKDQRKAEIWYQMGEYLSENYEIAGDS